MLMTVAELHGAYNELTNVYKHKELFSFNAVLIVKTQFLYLLVLIYEWE